MKQQNNEKHKQGFPTARKIKRACNKELYRTMKRLKIYLTPEQIAQAEACYLHKVNLNLQWIMQNESNRKAQSDWWEENVAPEIAVLWGVEPEKLTAAFRDAYGG